MKNKKLLLLNIFVTLLVIFKFNYGIAFLMALIHECVHTFVCYLLNYREAKISIRPYGYFLQNYEIEYASYKDEVLIYTSGPLSNIILGIFFYFIGNIGLVEINFALGLVNLLPFYPLDGGRIFTSFLTRKYSYKKVYKNILILSLIFSFLLNSFNLFTLLKHGDKYYYNTSLCIFGVFISLWCLEELERTNYIILGDIVKKINVFNKRKKIENFFISVHIDISLLEMVKLIERKKYTVFLVLDSSMNLIDTIYETEVMEAIKDYGNLNLREFLET
ncbi:MAG: site-2 protease family protein [Oscillospiraceae bacterium]|nr:site-2 protease family protein [Oscillospiraceae bacterium]